MKTNHLYTILILLFFLTASLACTTPVKEPREKNDKFPLSLSSPAFEDGGEIPIKYSCLGENTSPMLSWSEGPVETSYYVLIMDTTDDLGGIFTHWVLYNIPKDVMVLHEGISKNGILETGAIQGRNNLGKLGYFGPCPTEGETHLYYFTLYAVVEYLPLPSASREQVLNAIQGHILAQGQLKGTFRQ